MFANERYADWPLLSDPRLEGRVAFDDRLELLTSAELVRIAAFRDEVTDHWGDAARGCDLLVLDPASERGAIGFYTRARHAEVLFGNRDVVVLRA